MQHYITTLRVTLPGEKPYTFQVSSEHSSDIAAHINAQKLRLEALRDNVKGTRVRVQGVASVH